jgi:putative transposase
MKEYSTDLTDSQWQVIEKLVADQRRRKYSLRLMVNAILYLVKTGCHWRLLPHDFPKWQLVYYYFSKWSHNGTIEALQEHLVEKRRKSAGREEEPSVAIIDSQSIRSTAVSSRGSGFDAAKRTKGRKRHLAVDTLGLLLCVVVHSAAVQDREGAIWVLERLKERWKKIRVLFADGGYRGQLLKKAKALFGYLLLIVKKQATGSFTLLPKRWVVERTIAWLDTNRRLAKDFERYHSTSEAMTQIAAIRIHLKHF